MAVVPPMSNERTRGAPTRRPTLAAVTAPAGTEDAFRLGVQIFESGFRPNFIVGLWRGGSSVGIYVQECLQTLGVETDHIALRTSYKGLPAYQSMVNSPEDIRVHGTQYLIENLNVDDSLLIVDDVFSTGYNISAVINRLTSKMKRNFPSQVKMISKLSMLIFHVQLLFYLYLFFLFLQLKMEENCNVT